MKKIISAVILVSAVIFPAQAHAELKPEEVLIIANGGAAYSSELAEYYASKRNIPSRNILNLRMVPDTESIEREIYEDVILFQIKNYFQQDDLKDRIKCLVIMYGMPLKIGLKKQGELYDVLMLEKEIVERKAALEMLKDSGKK